MIVLQSYFLKIDMTAKLIWTFFGVLFENQLEITVDNYRLLISL